MGLNCAMKTAGLNLRTEPDLKNRNKHRTKVTDKNDPKQEFIMTEQSVEEALFTTRSMRHLKSGPVPRADLEFIIEAATIAPSAGNYQM